MVHKQNRKIKKLTWKAKVAIKRNSIWGPYKSALIAALSFLLRGAAVQVFYCGTLLLRRPAVEKRERERRSTRFLLQRALLRHPQLAAVIAATVTNMPQ